MRRAAALIRATALVVAIAIYGACSDTQAPPPMEDPPPTIALSRAALSFASVEGGANPADQTVTISNTGGRTLSWSAADDASWISISPPSGTGAGSLTVSVNTAGLSAGTYDASITVSAAGATNTPQAVMVTLTVAPPPSAIGLSPSSFAFAGTEGGANPAGQPLDVTNTGGGVLNWNASDDAPWLTLSPTSGTAPSTVTLSVNLAGLAAGTYTATVTVSSTGATNTPQTASVTLNVSPGTPAIGLTPGSFAFTGVEGSADPANQTLSISNTGGGTLNWTASDDAPWLSLSPTSGTAPSNVTVSVSTAGLAPGTYNGNITVAAAGAANTPLTAGVTLTVTAPPVISLSPTSFTFSAVEGGANPGDQTLNISNTGGGTLSWTVSDDAPWLTLSPTNGVAPSNVTLSVNTAGLTAGTYNGTITVTGAGATNTPQMVAVTLTVSPPPSIGVSPSSFSFSGVVGGANPGDQTLNISNTGGGTLAWTASDDATWLTLSSTSGTAPSTVTLSVNTAGLAVGTYNATVTVSATGAANTPQTVPVTLTVTQLTYNGSWSGLTFQDSTITFEVVNNAITTLSSGFRVPSCGVSGTFTTTFGTPIDVSGGSFNVTVNGVPLSYTISGTFSSATSVSGTITFNWSQNFPPVCTGSASGTWSATRP